MSEERMKINRLLLMVMMVLIIFSYVTEGSFGLKIHSCFMEEIGEEVLCGAYEVMENRQVRKGARIRLNFIILPAWTSHPAPDPVVVFSGGPGAGSAAWAHYYAYDYAKLRSERDIVLVDQRGTGNSNPLHCRRLGDPYSAQTYLQDMFPEDYVKNCRKELEERANLRYYHSTIAMADIADLCSALGYEHLNIVGDSYGAYAGIVFMKYYPERVRSAVLGFPALPHWTYPATIASYTQAALERLFDDCAADPGCSRDYPNLRQQLDRVVARLEQGPVTTSIINPIRGTPENVLFTLNNFRHGLRSLLYSASRSSWIPAFIHWAAEGNLSPIVEYTARYLWDINKELMDGMFLCVTCTETIPYIDYAEAVAQAEGTLMGTYRLEQQVRACDWWVRGDHPDDFHSMSKMNIPTLIFTGELDPVIPPRFGDELAEYLPNSLHVIIPNAGHEYGKVWLDCLDDVVSQFISQGFVAGLDASCADVNVRPPFVSWQDYDGNESERKFSVPDHHIKSSEKNYRELVRRR